MAYHNTQLPEDIEKGADGGPRFKTLIKTLASGAEKRNILWSRTRGTWDVAYGILGMEDAIAIQTSVHEIRDFWYARNGPAHSWPFKDWSDFELGKASPQSIHVFDEGDGATTVFQLKKRYTSGSDTYERIIEKPVSGIQIYDNGALQADPADYSIDLLTGIITFVSAPANTNPIGAIGEFRVPARFIGDELNITVRQFDAGEYRSLDIIEVRGE